MTRIKMSEPEIRDIDTLQNWDDNPRSVDKAEFERLKKQIKKLGMYKPLLINKEGIVLGGNMRLRALRELGVHGDVYVTVVDADTMEKMLEYALSDNDQIGTTDELILAEMVKLNPIETELFKIQGGNLKPLQEVIDQFSPSDDENQESKSKVFICPSCDYSGPAKEFIIHG